MPTTTPLSLSHQMLVDSGGGSLAVVLHSNRVLQKVCLFSTLWHWLRINPFFVGHPVWLDDNYRAGKIDSSEGAEA